MTREATARLRVCIRGAVQGVGFRPFVFRLAGELGLPGWVSNTTEGVFIEVEGAKQLLDGFLLRLQREAPPRSSIQSLESSYLDPLGFNSFEIRESREGGQKTALVLPDIAVCPDCIAEMFDPKNRRYLYPFINCTNCGPRFSIIEALPYDRSNTTMRGFRMCSECQREYEDPADRRFHAQPIACPVCGPHVELWAPDGTRQAADQAALQLAAAAIRAGKIVAVKGLGGFHLMTDARNDEAVLRLRQRKHREEKPFALMFPSLALAAEECSLSEPDERLLLSPEAPIVLLDRKDNRELYGKIVSTLGISQAAAPGTPSWGIMLPSTPLHHILMGELGHPIIATSGNLSDEPICIDERNALKRLGSIADLFLVHNRPIVRQVDDSIVRVLLGRELVLRRARGYAPLPIQCAHDLHEPVLAYGAHLKNTVALGIGGNAFVSQHIGDLETHQSLQALRKVCADFQTMYEVNPAVRACDLHPDYASTREAAQAGHVTEQVQHHHAHVLSCMAENQLEGEVLGVAWDGTGYGTDGTVWGGEFLLTAGAEFVRSGMFRTFRLPGGDKAIREPRRSALGLLFEMMGEEVFRRLGLYPVGAFTVAELSIVRQMLEHGINAPRTSSVGRIFDAVASLLGVRHRNTFEGQAAMELENALAGEQSEQIYRCTVVSSDALPSHGEGHGASAAPVQYTVDWSPMVEEMLADLKRCLPVSLISKKFHNGLVEALVDVARAVRVPRVVLTGGCFQSRYLTQQAVKRLRAEGFQPYWHQRVPPNDGGISLGQVVAVQLRQAAREERSRNMAFQE